MSRCFVNFPMETVNRLSSNQLAEYNLHANFTYTTLRRSSFNGTANAIPDGQSNE